MISREQKIKTHKSDGTTTERVDTYLFAQTGYLRTTENPMQCIAVQLGTGQSPEQFYEIEGAERHEIPDSLPDIDEWEEETQATEEDYIDALTELGVLNV